MLGVGGTGALDLRLDEVFPCICVTASVPVLPVVVTEIPSRLWIIAEALLVLVWPLRKGIPCSCFAKYYIIESNIGRSRCMNASECLPDLYMRDLCDAGQRLAGR